MFYLACGVHATEWVRLELGPPALDYFFSAEVNQFLPRIRLQLSQLEVGERSMSSVCIEELRSHTTELLVWLCNRHFVQL